MSDPYIITRSGQKYFFEFPSLEAITIGDIAHALSNICRYTGHCSEFYSVAEHSVLVSRMVPQEHALAGLMHDSPEAYVNDLSHPLKKLVPDHRGIEAIAWGVISRKFGLPLELHECVHQADADAYKMESRALMPPMGEGDGRPEAVDRGGDPYCWPPVVARLEFLRRYHELTGGKHG